MADVRHNKTLGNRFRFVIRALGILGALAAAVGAAGFDAVFPDEGSWKLGTIQKALDGTHGQFAHLAAALLLGGFVLVAMALVVEVVGMFSQVTGQRTAAGSTTATLTVLAIVLFVFVNILSLNYYKRYDCTRTKQFTLPPEVVDKLKSIDTSKPTTVVVLQLDKTDSQSTKPDALDYAAQRKTVEKVEDLVDQFRELGPQFKVVVLDVKDEKYDAKRDAITRDNPTLRNAIENTPENSVLFSSEGKVQRLAFKEFYRLDRPASTVTSTVTIGDKTETRNSFTNLTLLPQGTKVFADRLDKLDAKKPRIGLLTIHPYLSAAKTESPEIFTASGMKKTLEANGFEVIDVILKKGWNQRREPAPAAETFAEYELDRLENLYARLTSRITRLEAQLKILQTEKETVDKAPLDQIAKKLKFIKFNVNFENEAERKMGSDYLAEGIKTSQEALVKDKEQLEKVRPDYFKAVQNDKAVEARRSTDVKAKLGATLTQCDMLIVPKLTVFNLVERGIITPNLHNLDKDQAEVVREFVAAGKPVLALFGATNVAPGPPSASDDLEKIFTRFGFEFGNLTIMYDAETRAMAEQGEDPLSGGEVIVPAIAFPKGTEAKSANPISAALNISALALEKKLELRKASFRPVWVNPAVAAKLPYAATVAESAAEGWGESQPVPQGETIPEFSPAKPNDPTRGTRDEERRGSYPVGAAMESPIPAEWTDPKTAAIAAAASAVAGGTGGMPLAATLAATDAGDYLPKDKIRPTVRLAAFGHGGLFNGKTLDAAAETLLLHTVNWQLRRDDHLPQTQDVTPWQYPRVTQSARDTSLWKIAAFPLLSVAIAVMGLFVFMFRKMR